MHLLTVVGNVDTFQDPDSCFYVQSQSSRFDPVKRSLNVSRGGSEELTSGVLEQNLVVEAQAEFGHSRQEHAHLYGSHDLAA